MKSLQTPSRQNRTERARADVVVRVVVVVAGMLLASGCGSQPQLSPANRHVARTLRTAVSAKNPQWLETNAKLIEEQHAAAKLSEEEYAALKRIIDQARAGDWAGAKAAVDKLEQAQAPTAEELEQVKGARPQP